MIHIVAFRRTGTHFLANLLARNLQTPQTPEDMHYSHSQMPAKRFITIWRPLLPTMLSMYKMRERFGIARSCGFTDMVLLPIQQLPKTSTCDVLHYGKKVEQAHELPCQDKSLLELWREHTLEFARNAFICFRYCNVIADPLTAIRTVAKAFSIGTTETFMPVTERVGWFSVKEDEPELTIQVMQRIRAADLYVRGKIR